MGQRNTFASIFSHRLADEYDLLRPSEKQAVNMAIEKCRQTRQHQTFRCSTGGEAYADPHSDGYAWGFDNPCNIARGVRA